jgi:hypothetical protein
MPRAMVALTSSFSSIAMTRNTVVANKIIIPIRGSISADIFNVLLFPIGILAEVNPLLLHKTIEKYYRVREQ